jgi:hypothetical protein
MTNEAAERVKDWIMLQTDSPAGRDMRDKVDAALAAERVKATVGMLDAVKQASEAAHVAERLATVERIRAQIARWPRDGAVRDFLAILDEAAL